MAKKKRSKPGKMRANSQPKSVKKPSKKSRAGAASRKAKRGARGNLGGKANAAANARENVAKALSHWLRVEILAILNEREASPSEMAEELNQRLSNVSYHTDKLVQYETIVLVAEVDVGSTTEKRYRALNQAILPAEVWDRLPDEQKYLVDVGILRELWVDITASMEKGLFDSRESHLSITPMVTDDQGVKEAKAALDDALAKVIRIADEGKARVEGGDGKARSWTVGIAGFDSVRDPEEGLKSERKPKRKGRQGKAKGSKGRKK